MKKTNEEKAAACEKAAMMTFTVVGIIMVLCIWVPFIISLFKGE